MPDRSVQAPPATPRTRTGAAAAGGGLGTSLVALAQLLPESSAFRDILIYAAPGVAVGLTAVGVWAHRTLVRWVQEREAQTALKRARETLEARITNQNTSEQHRARLTRKLEELEEWEVAHQLELVNARLLVDPPALGRRPA